MGNYVSTGCQIVRITAMNLVKACFSVLLMGAMCFGAPSTDGGNEILSREKRTLGLVSAGAGAAASGLTTAGKLAAAGIAIVSAVKPLIMLGVGKYFLYNWLQKKQQPSAGNGIGFDASLGFGGQPAPSAPVWVEENTQQQNTFFPANTNTANVNGWKRRK